MPRRKRPEGSRRPNGTSSVYQSKDGKWHGRVTIGVRDDGKPDRRHVERKSEAEVIEAVRELEKQRDAGRVKKPGRSWTVEKWLKHWIDNIAEPSVRHTTMVGYRASVFKHLIPGIGAHRLDRLQPEHLESLYFKLQQPKRMGGKELKPATAHLVHRTASVAFNEAVRRRHMVENPARIAKPPRVEQEEIIPFTREEARKLIDTAAEMRNGARYIAALSIGLRRGEALGLNWSDLSVKWRHGCPKGDTCRQQFRAKKCGARQGRGTLTIRRALQQRPWQHGCDLDGSCGHRLGAYCPKRRDGGVVETEVKSRAGRRVIGLPQQVIEALEAHRAHQKIDRERAGDLWQEEDWMFTNRLGRPVHPTEDHRAWKALLQMAAVRDARLHDARHTAATILLELRVPLPAVMELMGWSNAAIAKRYMHTNDELVSAIAAEVGGHLWAESDDLEDDDDDGSAQVTVPV